MSVENKEDDLNENKENVEDNKKVDNEDDPVEKVVKQRVEESLKPLKGKLDDAYKRRDEALKKAAELEQKLKEQEIEKLQAQGKEKEALEMQLAEEKAKREALEKRNTELSRDVEVRSLLNTLPFRNEKAVEIGYREIVSQLHQDASGVWKHASGISINEFILAFAKDEDNAFLFKVKANTGGGTSNGTSVPDTTKKQKPLMSYTNEELIQMAREGKLRK